MSSYDEHLISQAGGDGDVLGEVEARVEAATPGPWRAANLERDHGHRGIFWVNTDHPEEFKTVAEVDANDDGIEAIWRMADAEFIAHARTDVPYLLALVREQAAKLEALACELDAEAAASDNVAAEIMKAPRTNTVRQELRDHERHATIATNHAARIRAALEQKP